MCDLFCLAVIHWLDIHEGTSDTKWCKEKIAEKQLLLFFNLRQNVKSFPMNSVCIQSNASTPACPLTTTDTHQHTQCWTSECIQDIDMINRVLLCLLIFALWEICCGSKQSFYTIWSDSLKRSDCSQWLCDYRTIFVLLGKQGFYCLTPREHSSYWVNQFFCYSLFSDSTHSDSDYTKTDCVTYAYIFLDLCLPAIKAHDLQVML